MSVIPSAENFVNIDIHNINLSVSQYTTKLMSSSQYLIEVLIYSIDDNLCHQYISKKTYKDFFNFYNIFVKKFPTVIIPEFPPKIQYKKHEHRMKFFNLFLNTIYDFASNSEEYKIEILNMLHDFIFKPEQNIEITSLSKLKLQKIFKIHNISQTNMSDDGFENYSKSTTNNTKSHYEQLKKDLSNENLKKKNILELVKNSTLNYDKNYLKYKNNISKHNKNKKYAKDNLSFISPQERFDSYDDDIDVSDDISIEGRSAKLQRKNSGLSTYYNNNINEWEDIYIKTPFHDYLPRLVRIKDQCLFIYEDSTKPSYYLMIPLYKINFEIIRCILPDNYENETEEEKQQRKIFGIYFWAKKIKKLRFKELEDLYKYNPEIILKLLDSHIYMKLFHDWDTFHIDIMFNEYTSINTIYTLGKCIIDSSEKRLKNTPYIQPITESLANTFGSILLEIVRLRAPYYDSKLEVKVKILPYTFPSKKVIGGGIYDYNQKFLIPIHNRFESLNFLVYKVKDTLLKKENEILIATYKITLSQLLSTYFLNENTIHVKLIPARNRKKYKDMSIEYRIRDCSSKLTLALKVQNKNIIEDHPLNVSSEPADYPYKLGVCLKRIKRVLSGFTHLGYLYQMTLHFKYPVLSASLMIFVIWYGLKCDSRYILTHILVLFFTILFFHSNFYLKYLQNFANKFFFGITNPYDTPSLIAKHEDQLSKEEVNEKMYLVKDKKEKKSFGSSIKKIFGLKKIYMNILFNITKFVAYVEKFKNLFKWTDPLLSFYVFFLLFLAILATWKIELRFLVVASFSKKFIKGIFYYKKKYVNNKEIAKILSLYVYKKYKHSKPFQSIEKVGVLEVKLQKLFKSIVFEDAGVVLDDTFFDKMQNFGDVIEEIGKVEELLTIKKSSPSYHYTKNNDNIFPKTLEPEDVLRYFIRNIKSDYFVAAHRLMGGDSDLTKANDEFNSDESDVGKDNKKKKK